MRKFILFYGLMILVMISGCLPGAMTLPTERGEIQPGLYTGTVEATIITTTISQGETSTQETVENSFIALRVNNDGTISSGDDNINVGDQYSLDVGEYPMTLTVNGISRDDDTITINFSFSGEWLFDGKIATISGSGNYVYELNAAGGLDFSQYFTRFITGDGKIVSQTSTGFGVMSK